MASNTITVPVQPLLREITLKVSGLRITSLRLRIAASIFAFGSWVAGINLVMSEEGTQADGLTYAKVGGPPADWHGLKVVDLDTGAEVADVIEVNTAEGWVISHKRDNEGRLVVDGDEVATDRRVGRFEIKQPTGWLETKRPLTTLRGVETYDPRAALLTREEMSQKANLSYVIEHLARRRSYRG